MLEQSDWKGINHTVRVHQSWPLTTGQGMTLFNSSATSARSSRNSADTQAAMKAIQISRLRIFKVPVRCIMFSMNSYSLQPRMLYFSAPTFLRAGILLIDSALPPPQNSSNSSNS